MEEPLHPQPVEETTRLLEAKLRLESRAKNGASWFYWIAGLSVLNSVILIAGGTFAFIFGLAFTQVIDAFASVIETELGMSRPGTITFAAFALDVALAAVFVGIGYAARKGNQTVYRIGIGLYGADALISLVFRDWLGILFHLFVLAGLVGGIKAMSALAPIQVGTAPLETLRPARTPLDQEKSARFRTAFLVVLLAFLGLFFAFLLWLFLATR